MYVDLELSRPDGYIVRDGVLKGSPSRSPSYPSISEVYMMTDGAAPLTQDIHSS